jgi:hypothetical protein
MAFAAHDGAHQQRDRDRHRDRKRRPRAAFEDLHHRKAHRRDRDCHREEDRQLATEPAAPPSSFVAIAARERPPSGRSPTGHKVMHRPASVTPTKIHSRPGRKPNCAASTGTNQRPSSGDGREVMAEQHPATASVRSPCHRFYRGRECCGRDLKRRSWLQ